MLSASLARVATVAICALLGGWRLADSTVHAAARPGAVSLQGLPANVIEVQVNDLRGITSERDEVPLVLKDQLVSYFFRLRLHPPGCRGIACLSTVDRAPAFFTIGNWNAATRLRARLSDLNGKPFGQWEASGTASSIQHVRVCHRSSCRTGFLQHRGGGSSLVLECRIGAVMSMHQRRSHNPASAVDGGIPVLSVTVCAWPAATDQHRSAALSRS